MKLTLAQRKEVQHELNEQGFGPLVVDGVLGKVSKAAIIRFKKSIGFNPRSYIGPLTFEALTGDLITPVRKPAPVLSNIPWVDEAMGVLGLDENRDYTELAEFLKSDGSTVGDPRKIPWCGDLVETAIKRGCKSGVITPTNPYLAANWNKWGVECDPCVGAIVVFWRGSPSSWKGHIGFIVGESKSNWYVLGGNQRDSITITPISKDRVRDNGIRWPGPSATDLNPGGPPPVMSGGTVTTNEV